MKALIFAAGLGTRLKPLTDNKPKALVEVNNITLLEHTVKKLKRAGVNEIIVNVYHFAEQIKTFLKQKNYFNIHIEVSDESGQLLDTGGGLKKASWFFDDSKPFFVHNVDVLSNVNLGELYQSHINSRSLATLAVKDRETSRYFLFNETLQLCGWKNIKTGEIKISRENANTLTLLAFSGIQVINTEIFELINEKGKFSLTDTYIQLAKNNKITGYWHDKDFWLDLGTPAKIKEGEEYLVRL
ncbi:MAG: nucleotidyltransferase family protein [Bacteroidetes bacterium]|nr:nucleotidyltransferase family protein [Bacteroidota bacterium]